MTENLFAALPAVPQSLVIGGETLDITPLKVGELPIFARTVRPIAGKHGPDPDWLRLLSEDGESVILALAIACRRPDLFQRRRPSGRIAIAVGAKGEDQARRWN